MTEVTTEDTYHKVGISLSIGDPGFALTLRIDE